ncbi:MAG TPA: IS110 family transposase [Anaerolineales bacterium]|nr:IS110 family transposase [Anaerolineales bacterium]
MFQHCLGIDVSKDTLDVVLWDGINSYSKVFKNSGVGFDHLLRWLISHQPGPVHACLEATGQYGEGVAEYLYTGGYAVSVVNPLRIKRYGDSKLHRNKTDKADAALIAEFCLKENPALWEPLPPHIKHLRELVRRLDDLQTNYLQEKNRLKSGLTDKWVIDDLKRHLEELHEHIQALKTIIHQFIADTPELDHHSKLLISIPGIGKLTAARLLAEIGDITNFEDAPQLAAYAGLNPKGFRSGSSVHKKTRISKEGRSFLRYILYMPAIVARKYNPIITDFCAKLSQRKLPEMAIVAAAMRKLLHLVFGILKNQQVFDPDYLKKQINPLDI